MSKKKDKNITQKELLMEYYKNHPGRSIEHPEIVDWATKEYEKRTGKVFRDPDRGIRNLHQDGELIKVEKGVYMYDPDFVNDGVDYEEFSNKAKEKILKRDDYQCVVCGRGSDQGAELHVDHIKPKDKGGKATVDNGQTLCSKHNFLKKTYSQTGLGKKLFIQIYKTAKKEKDEETLEFASKILELFEEYKIDDHIKWKK